MTEPFAGGAVSHATSVVVVSASVVWLYAPAAIATLSPQSAVPRCATPKRVTVGSCESKYGSVDAIFVKSTK
jgi:hypothetical protein